MTKPHDSSLARTLILDEIFDLALYRALRDISDGKTREILEELIRVEIIHIGFWQKFFHSDLTELDLSRRLKLRIIVLVCRLFGTPAIHLVLEAIEVYGVKKYLSVWKIYKDEPLGAAVKGILIDEFKHEDVIVTQLAERRINPEQVRNIFLGLNDGLVEIVGAVSGFFAAFGDAVTVLVAGSTTAVAGSLSMAAGAYVALGSEREVRITEEDKKRFLGESVFESERTAPPLIASLVVGGSYFAGAMVPLLPILFGAKSAAFSFIMAGSIVIVVSMVLAFLSGMDIKKRIATNLMILTGAVVLTYAIGLIAKQVWGISV
ncbi:MAG TPA: VIT1/CCC1 transporter family protein [Nitrospiraceae bacterium]|nr:VIT1/CCC1 transporter family protein [Nitrospiraceae bacterium]